MTLATTGWTDDDKHRFAVVCLRAGVTVRAALDYASTQAFRCARPASLVNFVERRLLKTHTLIWGFGPSAIVDAWETRTALAVQLGAQ